MITEFVSGEGLRTTQKRRSSLVFRSLVLLTEGSGTAEHARQSRAKRSTPRNGVGLGPAAADSYVAGSDPRTEGGC
jgi:hypothetical protein